MVQLYFDYFEFFLKKKVFVRDEFNLIKKRNSINLLKNKIYFKIIDKFIDAYLSIGKVNKKALISFGSIKRKYLTYLM